MPIGEQNTRITKPFDSEHLEELATQSAQVPSESSDPRSETLLAASSARMRRSVESDPRPTSKLHKDEILGLLDMSKRLGQASPTAPARTDPRTAHARLVPAGSTNALPATIDDHNDRSTQRMQAKHLEAVVESGQAVTPALLESVDWYGETDAAAAQARTRPRAPEAVLDELGGESPMTPSPEEPSTPPSQRTAVEVPRLRRSDEPARDAASFAMDRIAGPQLPQAPSSAGLRTLLSLIGLVFLVIVAFVGFAIAT
jgi:hypothetical protein